MLHVIGLAAIQIKQTINLSNGKDSLHALTQAQALWVLKSLWQQQASAAIKNQIGGLFALPSAKRQFE
jgi:hypothetical protein